MLMMMTLFYRQLSGPSNWPSYKKRCSWGSDHFPQSHLGIFFLHIQWFQCLLSVLFSCITPSTHPFVCVCVCVCVGAGSWRDSVYLQAISFAEDCNVWNRLWSERGIQGDTGTGRIWWPLLRHRQLMAHTTLGVWSLTWSLDRDDILEVTFTMEAVVVFNSLYNLWHKKLDQGQRGMPEKDLCELGERVVRF